MLYVHVFISLSLHYLAPPALKRPSVDVGVISDRLTMYKGALKDAETAGDPSKVRRYKRSIDTIVAMEKDAKFGRPINMDILPPVISTPKPLAPPQPVATPTTKAPPNNLIDLDDPQFNEFNLSEEDMATMMISLQQSPLAPSQATPTSSKPQATPPAVLPKPQTTPTTSQAMPPVPKPRATPSAPKPQATPNCPPGLIDLDTPEFAEFDLSEEDLATLAAQMNMNKLAPVAPPTTAPPTNKTTQSLPIQLVQPSVGGEGVTKEQVRAVLVERKDQYMHAMKVAKSKGDTNGQKQYGNVAVQFNRVIKSFDQGQALDLSGTPPPPPGYTSKYSHINISLYKSPTATNTTPSPQSSVTTAVQQQEEEGGGADPGIPMPKTPLEGLQQRLDKYKEGVKSAEEKGESSRVRRLGRIIKQYEDAIKATKAGKHVDYDDLPAPPGYPPIPVAPQRGPPPRPVQSLPATTVPTQLRPKVSVNDKQVQTLKQRGAEFQRAAREAKGRGDKDTTLMYLRYYKAIEQMIVVAEGGMPVDMSQVKHVHVYCTCIL